MPLWINSPDSFIAKATSRMLTQIQTSDFIHDYGSDSDDSDSESEEEFNDSSSTSSFYVSRDEQPKPKKKTKSKKISLLPKLYFFFIQITHYG